MKLSSRAKKAGMEGVGDRLVRHAGEAEYTACWRSAKPTMPLPNHIRKDLGHVADMFMIDVMVLAAPGKFSYLSNKTREPIRL